MDEYKNTIGFKLLLALGCTDATGPLMRKKSIVRIDKDNISHAQSTPYYHFDPNYYGKAKASRRQASAQRIYFSKLPENYLDDFDLACSAFLLNILKIIIPENFSQKTFNEILDKNKSKIFSKIFKGNYD